MKLTGENIKVGLLQGDFPDIVKSLLNSSETAVVLNALTVFRELIRYLGKENFISKGFESVIENLETNNIGKYIIKLFRFFIIIFINWLILNLARYQ